MVEYLIGEDCKIVVKKDCGPNASDHSITVNLIRPSNVSPYISMSCVEFLAVCELNHDLKRLMDGTIRDIEREINNEIKEEQVKTPNGRKRAVKKKAKLEEPEKGVKKRKPNKNKKKMTEEPVALD